MRSLLLIGLASSCGPKSITRRKGSRVNVLFVWGCLSFDGRLESLGLLVGHCDTVAMSYMPLANNVSIRREDVKSKTVEERYGIQ